MAYNERITTPAQPLFGTQLLFPPIIRYEFLARSNKPSSNELRWTENMASSIITLAIAEGVRSWHLAWPYNRMKQAWWEYLEQYGHIHYTAIHIINNFINLYILDIYVTFIKDFLHLPTKRWTKHKLPRPRCFRFQTWQFLQEIK